MGHSVEYSPGLQVQTLDSGVEAAIARSRPSRTDLEEGEEIENGLWEVVGRRPMLASSQSSSAHGNQQEAPRPPHRHRLAQALPSPLQGTPLLRPLPASPAPRPSPLRPNPSAEHLPLEHHDPGIRAERRSRGRRRLLRSHAATGRPDRSHDLPFRTQGLRQSPSCRGREPDTRRLPQVRFLVRHFRLQFTDPYVLGVRGHVAREQGVRRNAGEKFDFLELTDLRVQPARSPESRIASL